MCTGLIIGKKATENSVVLIARNEDSSKVNWDKCLTYRNNPQYYPAIDNPYVNNGEWTLSNGAAVKVPENNFAYSSIPDSPSCSNAADTVKQRFEFEARGINERNVAISGTNSMEDINDRIKELDPFIKDSGIVEAVITTLILPQAESARHGVELLGDYVKSIGAGEGNAILFADIYEAWYMEIASAHHWLAVRVPDNSYIAVANGLRIHDIDLKSEDVLHSDGLYEFIETNHLLDKPDINNLNFAKAFGALGNPYNTDRVWLMQKLLTPSQPQATRLEQYPLFMKPDSEVSVKNVMNILRSNYNDTVLQGIADRAIGVDRTIESHIITLNSKLSDSFKGVIWQSISSPLGSPYIPLYTVLDRIPDDFTLPEDAYAPVKAFWAFRTLLARMNVCSESVKRDITGMWHVMENGFIADYNHFVKSATDNDDDIRRAKQYSISALNRSYKAAKQAYDNLTEISVQQNVNVEDVVM
jgi:dipeptidase